MSKLITTIEDILADEQFLAWYFKTSEKEAALWSQWLQGNDAFTPLVNKAIAYLDEMYVEEKEVTSGQVDAAYTKLAVALQNTDTQSAVTVRRQFSWWVPAVAAMVLLMAGIFFFKNDDHAAETRMGSSFGTISEYKLPDGSDVLLNANSTVTMNKEWKENSDREVWVDGEAFFHVQQTVARNKFVVHAKGLDIIVTGTKFNVTNTKKETSVLLTEGSVTLRTQSGAEIKMKPGEFVSIEKNTPQKKRVNEEKILAWKQKKLVFENSNMEEFADLIKQHYGLTVTLSDDVKGETVSGILPNDSIDILLQSLEATGDFKITRTAQNILITKP